jgi:hypothetical protein
MTAIDIKRMEYEFRILREESRRFKDFDRIAAMLIACKLTDITFEIFNKQLRDYRQEL